jgi:hypothetical protein
MAQRFNAPFGSNGPSKKPAQAKPPAPEQQMQGAEEPPEQEPEDGAEIAQMHGPANEVHEQHEDEMGVHHVTSEHPDGHHHESDHGSREEAHEHSGKLKGIGGAQHKEQPQDEEEGEY